MQNASLLPVPELTPAAEYIPLSPLSYEVAEEYAMGMLSALQGTAALGAGLHIAGSLLIVYGQTLVKVTMHDYHCFCRFCCMALLDGFAAWQLNAAALH